METIPDLTAPPEHNETTNQKMVLLFWEDWHEESVTLKESILPALASATNHVNFACVQAEAHSDLSEMYGVTLVPSIVCLHNGQVVQLLEGNNVEVPEITQAVQKLAQATAIPKEKEEEEASTVDNSTVSPKENLNQRLQQLINASQVMLFMKGTPDAPRCGFSRQAIEILKEARIAFGSFDILSDQDVRQGLKEYSDWPTYPQIYVKGELVGGLDIIKEMKADEETTLLAEQLGVAPEPSLEDRLKSLVNRHHVMLFMKGVPSAPRCGFSRKMVELLNENEASYDTFDILEDDDVRQGLKKFSDWPTYPQLYVDGELVGGLDICREMVESGELQDLIKR